MSINATACTCGVPLEKHGTCCGWDNAKKDIAPTTAIANYDADPEQKHYGLYQLCPKCDGDKVVLGYDTSATGISAIPCNICKGEGVLVRPEIKKDS